MENFENENIIRSNLDYKETEEVAEIKEEELNEIEIPSSEELEQLKESDFEEYLRWIDIMTKKEQIKNEREMEEIAKQNEEETKKAELDSLYTNDTKEQRRNSYLYGQD